MIKILFLIPDISGGGAEKVLCNLVNNMDQSQFNITVQTINDCDGKKYLNHGIHYKSIINCKSKLGRKIFSYWFRFCAEMKWAYNLFIKDDYDIEVAYLETSPTKLIAQSTNKKAAKIAWVHCDLSKKENISEIQKRKMHKQYSKFSSIVCVSEGVKAGFEVLFGKIYDSIVLYNVIDEEEIFNKAKARLNCFDNKRECQLLAVGRLTLQKNYPLLIDACAILKEQGYKFHLTILGDGPDKEMLQNKVDALNLKEDITLKGFVSNPYPWIANSDVVVCASLYEGISTVVQEALILDKLVVTTPCTGMSELLGDSECGYIASDFTAASLATTIENSLLNKEHNILIKKNAHERGLLLHKRNIIEVSERFFKEQCN